MKLKKIIRLFEQGSVCVVGMKGRGKDLLFSNVIARRKLPYISNVDYEGEHFAFDIQSINCGENTYRNFINGNIIYYEFPYPDGTDLYLSDVGVYFPSQYCSELNRDYKYVPVFMALSRHLGLCSVHLNVQNLNRSWDKLREQSDTYILCRRCHVFFGKIVLQWVRIYDKYESCLTRQPPFRLSLPLMASKEMKLNAKIEKERYECTHGSIKSGLLIYLHKGSYDSRVFKTMLKEGKKIEKQDEKYTSHNSYNRDPGKYSMH